MTKRFWIDEMGRGFNDGLRCIHFNEGGEAERTMLLESGIKSVHTDKLDSHRVVFRSKDRGNVVRFFKSKGIKVS